MSLPPNRPAWDRQRENQQDWIPPPPLVRPAERPRSRACHCEHGRNRDCHNPERRCRCYTAPCTGSCPAHCPFSRSPCACAFWDGLAFEAQLARPPRRSQHHRGFRPNTARSHLDPPTYDDIGDDNHDYGRDNDYESYNDNLHGNLGAHNLNDAIGRDIHGLPGLHGRRREQDRYFAFVEELLRQTYIDEMLAAGRAAQLCRRDRPPCRSDCGR